MIQRYTYRYANYEAELVDDTGSEAPRTEYINRFDVLALLAPIPNCCRCDNCSECGINTERARLRAALGAE